MSAQLKEKAFRIQQFLLWLESRRGADTLSCQKSLNLIDRSGDP